MRQGITLLVLWLLPACALFGPVVTSTDSFGFRDAAHYYPPLWQSVRQQWSDGLPLWNPNDERGRPLLADPTAAVLYPGQLIFALPIAFTTAFEWHLVIHVLLSGITSFLAARRLKLALPAAALGAISYAYGGSIVFQYCNPPYLISAAWLPLGVSAVLRIMYGSRWPGVVELCCVLAMMVLGGDPQTAYLLGVASLWAVALAAWPLRAKVGGANTIRAVLAVMFPLATAGLLGVGLAAAVWLPAWSGAASSDRAPQTSHAAAADLPRPTPPIDQDHRPPDRYQFSIGPWRWIELLWPNIAGRPFPQNERWITRFPAERTFWTPSLYMGMIPLLLGLAAFRLRAGALADRWLSWLVLFGAIGSLGQFGMGWLIAEIEYSTGISVGTAADEFGGVYWLLTNLLPGFHWFRYPGKLWTWTALGLSLLAAIRLHHTLHQHRPPFPRRWITGYVCATTAFVGAIWLGRRPLQLWLTATPSDLLFGPFQFAEAHARVMVSLVHGILLGAIVLVMTRRSDRALNSATNGLCVRTRIGWSLVALTAVDLAFSHAWLVPRVNAEILHQQALIANSSVQHTQSPTDTLTWRAASGAWYPSAWASTRSAQRLSECMRWDRLTARPKYPLQHQQRLLRSSTSFSSADQVALLNILDQVQSSVPTAYAGVLEQLGVNLVYGPASLTLANLVPLRDASASDVHCWQLANPRPRAWIVHSATYFNPLTSDDLPTLQRRTRDVLLVGDQPRDFSAEVVLEEMPTQPRAATEPDNGPLADDVCHVRSVEGARKTIETQLSRPGWLVINDSFAPGWQAVIRSDQGTWITPVLRANRVMQGVALPAGAHEVTLVYQPPTVVWGLRISCVTLFGVMTMAIVLVVRRVNPG